MMKTPTGIGGWIASSYEAKVPFLQQVPRECADFLLLNAQIREYDAGEIIVQGGVEGQFFCVMQSGRAQVCGQILPDGHYSVLAYIESGACFAEMSILCNEPTSNTIIAAEDGCTVLHIPKAEFVKFLDKNPNIMVFLYKVVCDSLRATNKAFDEFQRLSLLASGKVLPFIDFAQTMEKSRITGTVICESNQGGRGFVAFQDGRICCAKCGKLAGPDALEQILAWGDDSMYKLDTHLMPETTNINQMADTTSLILDALRNIDEKQGAR